MAWYCCIVNTAHGMCVELRCLAAHTVNCKCRFHSQWVADSLHKGVCVQIRAAAMPLQSPLCLLGSSVSNRDAARGCSLSPNRAVPQCEGDRSVGLHTGWWVCGCVLSGWVAWVLGFGAGLKSMGRSWLQTAAIPYRDLLQFGAGLAHFGVLLEHCAGLFCPACMGLLTSCECSEVAGLGFRGCRAGFSA